MEITCFNQITTNITHSMQHFMNPLYEGYFMQYNKHIRMTIWVAWILRKQINQSQEDYISKKLNILNMRIKYWLKWKKRSEDNCFLPRISALSVNKMTLNKSTARNRKLNQNTLPLQKKKILNIASLWAFRNNYHQLGRGNKY